MMWWRIPVRFQIFTVGILTILLFTNSFDFICNGETREQNSAGSETYEIAAKVIWDSTSHPQNFPANATFSPFIFVIHEEDMTFWREGDPASPGVKLFVESGDYTLLETELQALKDTRQIFEYYISNSLDDVSGQVETIVETSYEYDHYSMIMKVNPSPDWFLGVYNMPFKRYDDVASSYQWRVHESTNLYPLDAGTDAGVDFGSPDDSEVTPQPIQQFTAPNAYPFLNPSTNIVRPVGRIVIKKV